MRTAGVKFKDGSDLTTAYVGNPVGTLISNISTITPSGYLYCNGQTLNISQYQALFNAIGTTYGGNGVTTFKVPDIRGYFLRGLNDGSGNDVDASFRTNFSGGTVGDVIGSKQIDELKSHKHIDGGTTDIDGGASYGGTGDAPDTSGWRYPLTQSTGTRNPYTSNTGGNETRPKNIAVKYYIKY